MARDACDVDTNDGVRVPATVRRPNFRAVSCNPVSVFILVSVRSHFRKITERAT